MPQPFTNIPWFAAHGARWRTTTRAGNVYMVLLYIKKRKSVEAISKSVDAFQSCSSLKTENIFLFWYVIWFCIQNLGGPPCFGGFACLLSSSTDFGNFVYHWLSLVFWVTSVFFFSFFSWYTNSVVHELGTPRVGLWAKRESSTRAFIKLISLVSSRLAEYGQATLPPQTVPIFRQQTSEYRFDYRSLKYSAFNFQFFCVCVQCALCTVHCISILCRKSVSIFVCCCCWDCHAVNNGPRLDPCHKLGAWKGPAVLGLDWV